jgi:hypothetical protein
LCESGSGGSFYWLETGSFVARCRTGFKRMDNGKLIALADKALNVILTVTHGGYSL